MSLRFSELDGASVGVWGAGREIRSFAAQLTRHLPLARIAVIALDAEPDTDVATELGAPDARVATGTAVAAALADCDVLVRSPGVSIYRRELQELRAVGKPVTTATALWLAEREGRGVIGVTGTKGKSTTAALMAHLARTSEPAVALAGNIGVPALDLLERPATELAVVELSSYQIADLEQGPEVAVVTSLFREHSEWHGSEQAYFADKLRLLDLPGVRMAVVNGRDPRLVEAASGAAEATLYGVPHGWDVGSDGVTLDGEPVLNVADLPLRGAHNALNLCAALAGLQAFGLALAPLPDALLDFQALAHRLEVVSERDGALWVDDSISTTPESTLAALASFEERKIVLLGGGQDRGQDYTELGRTLAEREVTVIGLPSTGPRLLAAARRAGVPTARAIETTGMNEAVARARALAGPGVVVLLSPAAPSYDSYSNFQERGAHFRALADLDGATPVG
jgi:UDP-N-acetylmuramoylalanine--D-glutamate ligase